MFKKLRQLGQVTLVQIQPSGLIKETPGKTPTGGFYDPTYLVSVDRLEITPLGIEATTPGGERELDIHHINHPDKKYDNNDLISIAFSSHYDAMRARFGDHIVNGIAGENIIIEYTKEIWPADLSQKIGVENQESGEMAIMELNGHANPCVEYASYCLQNQHGKIPAKIMKETLQFLGNGRRGFLFVLSKEQDVITVRPGDKVYTLGEEIK